MKARNIAYTLALLNANFREKLEAERAAYIKRNEALRGLPPGSVVPECEEYERAAAELKAAEDASKDFGLHDWH